MQKILKKGLSKSLSMLLATVLMVTMLPLTARASTAPAFAEGYPKLGAVEADGSKKINVLVRGALPDGETSMSLGYVLLADNDPAPTAEQIKSSYGNIPGSTVITWGQQSLGDIEKPITLNGAEDNTDYEFYAVCWTGDKFSQVSHLAVKTPAGSGGPGTTMLASPTGLKWDTGDGIKGKWDPVTNTTSYDVTLWKEGQAIMLVKYTVSTGTEVNVQSNITGHTGNYYFTVQAKADGYTSSLKPASPIYSYIAPLYGNVTIDNMSPKVGDTLTGSLGGGNNTGTLHYTWKAGGSQVGTDAASYTVTAADLGKTITLEITSSVETGIRTSAATEAVVTITKILEVSTPSQLEDALGIVADGDTIKLLADIDYNQGIVIDGMTITFDVGSFTLNVTRTTSPEEGTGLLVKNGGHVNLSGNGEFNISQTGGNTSAGLWVEGGSSATVTNIWVGVQEGSAFGAYAYGNGSSIRVLGNISVNGAGGCGAKTFGKGKIIIDGTIKAASYINIGTDYNAKDSGVEDLTMPEYLKYGDVSGIIWVKKTADAVCQVDGTPYTTLDEALETLNKGETKTITLLKDIDYDKGIHLDNIKITFELNGHTLNVVSLNKNETALGVFNGGCVYLSGEGALNATGAAGGYGVTVVSNATTSEVTVTNATAYSGGKAAHASNKAQLTVLGDVTATGGNSFGVHAQAGAIVEVKGNVKADNQGVSVSDAAAKVAGNVQANGKDFLENPQGIGVNVYQGVAEIGGNVTANRIGAMMWAGGTATINGTITAPAYIKFADDDPTEIDGYLENTTKSGYRTYHHKTAGTVWVKGDTAPEYVCTIGDTGYTTLVAALDAVQNNETITLLQNIDYTQPVAIDSKVITFALEGFNLNIDTSATAGSTGLAVSNGGKVSCTGSGKLNVTASTCGLSASGASEIHISGNVVAGKYGVTTSGYGNPKVTVDGDVTVTGQGASEEVEAISSGGYATVTIGGHVTANRTADTQVVLAVYCNGSTITIGKDVTTQGSGVNVQNKGKITIDGTLNFNPTGIGAQSYIKLGYPVVIKIGEDFEDTSTKPDYKEYKNGDNIVWIKGDMHLGKPIGLGWDTSVPGELKAKWNSVPYAGQYKVEYYKNGEKLGMETHVNPPDTSTGDMKDNLLGNGQGNYTFTVRAMAAHGSGYLDSPVSEPSEPYSHSLTAYTVTFNPNGGNRIGGGQLTQTVPNGGSATAPTISRSGYTFTGWDKEFTKVTQDLTVTATWRYNGGGSSGGDSIVNGSIMPKTISFDKNPENSEHSDRSITLSRGSYILSGIKLDGKALIKGTDYIVNANTVTLKKAYLSTLKGGLHQLVFHMSGGTNPVLTITITDKTKYSPGSNIPFEDVMADDWFANSVMWAYESGLMEGVTEEPMLFHPYSTTTRAMVVTILHRLEGTPAITSANPYDDADDGKWYTNAAIWATENKIVSGYGNGKFGPEDPITREQMAVILMNYAKLKGYDVSMRADLTKFTDWESISPWAKDAMDWAIATGLIKGDGNKLIPAGNAQRCQIAAILSRFTENMKK